MTQKPSLAIIFVLACSFFIAVRSQAQWASGSGSTIYNTNNGFVGISDGGLFTPSTLLHLYTTNSVAEQKIQTSVDGYAQLTLEANNIAYQWTKRPSYEGNVLDLWYFNGTSWAASPYLTIFPSGAIGVGTTSVGSQLMAVNGNFFANKVTVALGTIPDFVFEKTYPLLPLDSLAAYLTQYHHLPGIPSAKEVKKNGLDLGQNQALLLQKIEELTLYTIRQDSELTRQKTENQQLYARLNNLEEQLGRLQQQMAAISSPTGK
jgi:hypothetical protein